LGKRSKEAIEEEMADVFAWLCSLANLLGVDLSQALLKKYPDVCYRCRKAPCQCKDSD
jgi:NTP pyrophosphatase (non-canonical NTP hydrolase)